MCSLYFISTIPFNPSERGIISPQFLIGRMRLGSEKWVDLLKTHGCHRIKLKLQPTQTNCWVNHWVLMQILPLLETLISHLSDTAFREGDFLSHFLSSLSSLPQKLRHNTPGYQTWLDQ